MLNYKILENKSIITKDNTKFIDLLGDTYIYDENKVKGFPLLINKYYVARPDLVALAVYGDDKYGDIICKINGISNPFELNENDIIYIPNLDFILKCTKEADSKNDFIDNSKENYLEIQNDNNFQKRKNEKRSPNQQVTGDSNYVIDKSLGIVFY